MSEVPVVPLGKTLTTQLIQHRFVDEPLPELRNTGQIKEEMFSILAKLKPRQCVEVNRSKRSVQTFVLRFRQTYGMELKYRVRPRSPGWMRVWRVE
jgi:hypothetical protein